MEIIRYETNFNKNIYLEKTKLKDKRLSKFKEREIINIYPELEYQELLGFGGAATEAAGYAFSKLPNDKKETVIKDYFSSDGLDYSIIRLPIGSCDFGLKSYSYSRKQNLSDFSIEKDKEYIIPLLKAASQIKDLTLFASPWSPPAFMKNTRWLTLGGKLRRSCKQVWANYFVKYIESYKAEGFDIQYVTVQNEPNAIQLWESCLYNPKQEANFAINYLHPTFKKNNINTKILIWDHNKERLFNRALEEFSIDGAMERISGCAYHYYSGDHFENLTLVREKFPNKLLIHTEGCTGYSDFRPEDEIGNGELYAHDILGDLNSGSNGYIDWNLILDHSGGPNHKNNNCNSPIMLSEDENDYIKNLTFFYIGHFSKFIKPGAKRLGFSKYTDKIEVTSFKNPDGTITIVVLNKNNFGVEYNICINNRFINDYISEHCIFTYIIKQ